MARTDVIKPYLFASIDEKLSILKAKGVDVISFGVGDPDSPPPEDLLKKLGELILNPENHNYSPYEGVLGFREAAARYMEKFYNVKFNPADEIVGLIGSKEGIGNTFIAYTHENDLNIVPSLSYPIPKTATKLAGGTTYIMPTPAENGFLPDLDKIPVDILDKAKLLYLNYPNNPTGISAPPSFYKKALDLAIKHDFTIVHDAAYDQIYYENKPLSFFEFEGAKGKVLEFHSLSKMFNVTGWRLAFVAGSKDLLKPLKIMKTNMDSGQFKPVQLAGAWALDNLVETFGKDQRKTYKSRLEKLKAGLEKLGAEVKIPGGTFFLWGKVPAGLTSEQFTNKLLDDYGIFVTPGHMFAPEGEGYFRASLTVTDERLDEALERINRKN
jgi:LL-diaminopimelate aminotransferase